MNRAQSGGTEDAVLPAFLAAAGLPAQAHYVPLSGDASSRCYWRLLTPPGRIIARSPHIESDVRTFCRVAGMLQRAGLAVPEIFACDETHGLLLLEDLGAVTLSAGLDATPERHEEFYMAALETLTALQNRIAADDPAWPLLPHYDSARFIDQALLFPDVFVPAVRGGRAVTQTARAEFADVWPAVLEPVLAALPPVVLHRDFHAGNLIWRPQASGVRRCGVLDFQDAGRGPPAYDLVSLLEDARRDLPAATRAMLYTRFCDAQPPESATALRAAIPVLAALRHLRVLAVFVRLAQQGKSHYLTHLPHVWRLLLAHLETAPALAPVAIWLQRQEVMTCVEDRIFGS